MTRRKFQIFLNKKVLLSECKRHTTLCIPCACFADQSPSSVGSQWGIPSSLGWERVLHPVLDRGTPSNLGFGGTTSSPGVPPVVTLDVGTPHQQDGIPLHLDLGWGTPISRMGYPPSRPGMGYPHLELGWGTNHPDLGWGTLHQQDGVPPPDLGWFTPLFRPGMGYLPSAGWGTIWTWDGVPPVQTWDWLPPIQDLGWGTPILNWDGVPTIQTWDGVPPISRMGFPLLIWNGLPPCLDLGIWYPPSAGWGTPFQTWYEVPPVQTCDGVPPSHPDLDIPPPISRMGYPHPDLRWDTLPSGPGMGYPPPVVQTWDGVPPTNVSRLKILPSLILGMRAVIMITIDLGCHTKAGMLVRRNWFLPGMNVIVRWNWLPWNDKTYWGGFACGLRYVHVYYICYGWQFW